MRDHANIPEPLRGAASRQRESRRVSAFWALIAPLLLIAALSVWAVALSGLGTYPEMMLWGL